MFPPLTSLPSLPGISVWDSCELHSSGERRSKWKRDEPYENRWFLTVPEMTCKKKDDGDEGSYLNHLFILCSDPPLFLQSLWHGCTASHVIEVRSCEFLCQQPAHASSGHAVVDIGSIDMEIRCLVALRGFQQLALAPSLLRPVAPTRLRAAFPSDVVDAARREMTREFPFNEDQQRVVDSVLAFVGKETQAPAIQLVQGVFGSGKSFLVAGLLILLHSLQQARRVALHKDEETDFLHLAEDESLLQSLASSPDETFSVLFCSHTNVAVDRVCLLLLEHGFTHFRRAGNPRRIHPQIRPHYQSRADGATQSFNVTCSTICGLPADQNYDIVIIDEASQVYEYYALLPILLARPQCVLLIGDQNQLPPVPIGTFLAVSSPDHLPTLSQSLFQRLLPLYAPQLLRTQYRCHPAIANLASSLFYGGRLLNAESTERRCLAFARYPRLAFIHNASSEVAQGGGSSSDCSRRFARKSGRGGDHSSPAGGESAGRGGGDSLDGRDFALRGAGEDAGAQSDGPEHPDLDGGRVSGE